jgi:hypothetical protein
MRQSARIQTHTAAIVQTHVRTNLHADKCGYAFVGEEKRFSAKPRPDIFGESNVLLKAYGFLPGSRQRIQRGRGTHRKNHQKTSRRAGGEPPAKRRCTFRDLPGAVRNCVFTRSSSVLSKNGREVTLVPGLIRLGSNLLNGFVWRRFREFLVAQRYVGQATAALPERLQ